ncbi:MAG TPA: outer membrane beta-barrel protein [Xanthobacteraceae bacterium]|nr:outer membrane beta-barrel protein [Xanthobacteraceae bacterium]
MRKLLVAAAVAPALLTALAANAADLPVAPAPVPLYGPPLFSWTGFYVGGNVGGAWAQSNVTDTLFGLNFTNGDSNGRFIGGGEVGFNYQFNYLMVGVEGDFDWVAADNSATGIATPAGVLTLASNNTWISTLAARFGFVADRALFYAKAGGGWVGNNGFTVTNTTTGAAISGVNNNNTGGWLVGAGVEWAFAYSWTVKLEYDYLGLNSQSFTIPATAPVLAGDTLTTGNRSVQMLKLGVNYLFNWGGPTVARY